MEIEGKKAVIVGGASGFGRATAESLAKRGASVAVLDRPNSDGQQVADGIGGAFYPVDVMDFAGTEQVLQQAVDALGGLHIAVTTAGGGSAMRTLTKNGPHDLDIFRQVQDLNTVGTFNISRLAAFHMSKNEPEDDERGVIINTSSIAAFEGQIGQIAYTASKAAIAGMCLTMSRPARGVRQARGRDRGERDAQRTVHPLGRRPALRPQVERVGRDYLR
jgi:NAD(P)-dependent dehydrogenase (short-subunit alcohol dehydrogenase family)